MGKYKCIHLSHGCFIKICIRYFGLSQICSLAQKEFSHTVTLKKGSILCRIVLYFQNINFCI